MQLRDIAGDERRAGEDGAVGQHVLNGRLDVALPCGIPERVAMQLTGHKTGSVFEHYNIVS